ncbi:Gamma-glutamyl hydrolase [Amphibalanus amphitrite]|uniref:folate gamma-glutamyl hydrolase n=1 Tax=Amphibalanus amphitrite TaxID=1232801 RepID=A0A6A4WEX3_AMPAM|nr:gamma-glutamyl hydrolase-like [Amphibalanus amphitrite]XP_043211159.1 gamma-glutamyl hydrolase-like [Amphibalanus amphitrite]KAF0305265.1 Gamma-glutamyl hydrolase [Amphibalanus amphitrite]
MSPSLLLVLSAAALSVSANDRPIIGILAQETTPDIDDLFPELNYTSYVQASYVQFVESAGARAAPVFIHRSQKYYEDMFYQLNGLLLPGGNSQLDSEGFGAASRAFWDLAHAHPEVHFPIWGTCQGHEELAFLAGGAEVIEACDAENQLVAVSPEPALLESRLFANATAEQLALFTVEPNVVMFHSNCVSPESFSRLAEEFRTLATNTDRQGVPYVSIVEHRQLPIYGVQFHPEKAAFEWSTLERVDQVPHWADAVEASQYLANFLVAEARRSEAVFPSEATEQAALIYNYPAYFTAARGSTFQMCYFFDDSEYM